MRLYSLIILFLFIFGMNSALGGDSDSESPKELSVEQRMFDAALNCRWADVFTLFDEHPALIDLQALCDCEDENCNAKDFSLLHYAANGCGKDCCVGAAQKLMDRGADTTLCTDDSNWSALHLAARNGHLLIVRSLLNHGARKIMNEKAITLTHQHRWTPFYLALYNNQDEVAELLYKEGADISAGTDEHDRSPLHVAAYEGNVIMAQKLLEWGASLEVRDDAVKTPLDVAQSGPQKKIADHALESKEKRELLKNRTLIANLIKSEEKIREGAIPFQVSRVCELEVKNAE